MQRITLLKTKAFSRTLKDLQRDKSCRNVSVLAKILGELIEQVGSSSLTHFFSYKGMRFYKKRLKHPCSRGGRSGGARIIFSVSKGQGAATLVLIAFYLKSGKEAMTEEDVLGALTSGIESIQDKDILGLLGTKNLERFLKSLK